MKRRCLSILLVLCMVMTLLPTTAFAEEVTSGTCGENLTWTLDTNGGLTISGTGRMENYSGSGGSSVAAGSPGAPWYAQRNMITTITIEEGVTSIGDWAFAGCGELTGVSIPDSVTTIGSYAFRYCTSLTSVEIGSSVTSIGDSAFYEFRKLINVTIPSSVTDIGGTAFESSPWLAQQGEFVCVNGILLEYQGVGGNVVIPDSITSIGIKAFSSCSKLTSVTIPTSVTRIGNYAFMFCNNLTDIYFTGSKAQWQDIEIEYQFYEATIPQRATIHYDSTGPDGPVLNNTISVYFLSGWDATTRNAQFGDDEITPYTYTVADSIDVSNISSLLNKYVLVMLEQGDSSLEYTITDIQPVESKIGTVSATGEHSLTIDGITYPVREDYVLALYDGKEVLYHVYNGTIMGFDVLEEKHGVLGSWNDATKKVTIGGAEYPTNYLTDFSFMDNIRDYFQKDVYFLIADSSGYCPMIKITGLYSPGANVNKFNADIYHANWLSQDITSGTKLNEKTPSDILSEQLTNRGMESATVMWKSLQVIFDTIEDPTSIKDFAFEKKDMYSAIILDVLESSVSYDAIDTFFEDYYDQLGNLFETVSKAIQLQHNIDITKPGEFVRMTRQQRADVQEETKKWFEKEFPELTVANSIFDGISMGFDSIESLEPV